MTILPSWFVTLKTQDGKQESFKVTSNNSEGAIICAAHSRCYKHGTKYRDLDGKLQIRPSREPIELVEIVGMI